MSQPSSDLVYKADMKSDWLKGKLTYVANLQWFMVLFMVTG